VFFRSLLKHIKPSANHNNLGTIMNTILANTFRAGAISLALLTAVGCQSTKALDEVRTLAEKAERDAANAQATANSATTSANSANNAAAAAKTAADNAQATANQALQAARSAQAGVDATNEKMDRMFKKTVSK
jgi:methyl-accepting chemotaxis protein